MKAYIVKDNHKYSNDYILFPRYEPWFDDKQNKWLAPSEGVNIRKKDISGEVKLPNNNEIVEVNLFIIKNNVENFTKGCKVSYTSFNLGSFIFGGLIYGGCYDKHIVEVQGIDWYDKKILVQKHNDKKPKWYNWNSFEIDN